MSDKFEIALKLNNIGPHYGENAINNFSDTVSDNRTIIFAANGRGKTFISRSFRLTSPDLSDESTDDLLSFHTDKGEFEFSVGLEKRLSISLARGQKPLIKNETGWIFHVFNSDYVRENIEQKNYTPNGDIEGYILGKANIDLTKEYENREKITKQLEDIQKDIDKKIEEARSELLKQEVKASTREFELLTKNKLVNDENVGSVSSFEIIKTQLDTLKNVPENIKDIAIPIIDLDLRNLLSDIQTLLTTNYPKPEWDKSFVLEFQKNKNFIEIGLNKIRKDNKCPFCKQILGKDALALINQYKKYLNDEQTKVLRKIDQDIEEMDKAQKRINAFEHDTKEAIFQLTDIQQYFPSLADIEIKVLDASTNASKEISNITQMLRDKVTNLSNDIHECLPILEKCKSELDNILKLADGHEKIIEHINSVKNDSKEERLLLRRNLCKAQYLKYKKILEPNFKLEEETKKELEKLEAAIKNKEDQIRTSKRDKVYETLKENLSQFFGNKYSVNKETFNLIFLGDNLNDNAMRVLSDGEKSVVAFCLYLASTHTLIEHEDDYNRLFFVIDDPISSMDYDHVYTLMQLIRTLRGCFGITTYVRMLILTHNMEFLSLMSRNGVVKNTYILTSGQIKIGKNELLLPYESHLRDILDIANEKIEPGHTTPNSIRHVLETICQFEHPDKHLGEFVCENEILSKNAYIYSLCEDLSHGTIRKQPTCTPEILVDACQTVITFMEERYSGQIKVLS